MTIPFDKLKARLMASPKVKAEYDALAPEFEIAAGLLRARRRAGLSQAELAIRMRTSQSTIARLESGQTLPSTRRSCAMPRRLAASFTCGCRRLDAAFVACPATKSWKIVEWRATADEDGHYCFAVAL